MAGRELNLGMSAGGGRGVSWGLKKKRCANIVESTSAQKIYRIVRCRKGKGNVEINCFRAWEQNSAKLFDVQKNKKEKSERERKDMFVDFCWMVERRRGL